MQLIIRALALFAAMATAAAAAHAQNISIATGGTGGVYYPLGGGMAAVLSKYVPGIQATAEVTGGSVANLQLIGTGKPYLGMTMADATLDAYKGEDKFKGKPVPVRTLLIMYPNRMHVVTIEGTGINSMKDLKDNRIATVNNLLVAHQNMDDKTAYSIVKAVFDHKDDLVRTHKEAENIKLENQKKDASPVPWHPGAVKYFAEKGITLK